MTVVATPIVLHRAQHKCSLWTRRVMTSSQLDLLKLAWEEEKFFLEDMHRRLVFFGGLLPVLLGATIAGLFQAKEWWHFAALASGPVLVFLLTGAARRAVTRSYQRFLEAIARKAKLEVDLGMGKERATGGEWFERESLLTPRHRAGRLKGAAAHVGRNRNLLKVPVLRGRTLRISLEYPDGDATFASSEEFVNWHLEHGGVQTTYRRFFFAAQGLSVALLVLLTFIAWSRHPT